MAETRFRRALVTGAAGGLGSELCRLLAADGTQLVLFDWNESGLERLRGELARSVDVHTCSVDIRNAEAFEQALRDVIAKTDGIDLVVANAGIDHPVPMAAGDWTTLRDHFATNIEANFVLCGVLVPHLLERGGGHLVAIASLGGLSGFPYEAGYCASKAGLAVFIEAVRAELAPRGITCTTVFPGFIDTPMLHSNAFNVRQAMTARAAAAKIHRAMLRRKPTLHFPLSTYLLLCVAKLLPVRVRDPLARNQMKRGFA